MNVIINVLFCGNQFDKNNVLNIVKQKIRNTRTSDFINSKFKPQKLRKLGRNFEI